jgi:hypothetical protein
MGIELKNLESQITWGEAVKRINDNNLALKIEIEKLQAGGGSGTVSDNDFWIDVTSDLAVNLNTND